MSNGSFCPFISNTSILSTSSLSSYAAEFKDIDEFNGICFCLLEFFTAVINCLSIHILANVLKELCFSKLNDFTALYNPIIPSCIISSFSAPIIKNLFAFAFTKSLYLFRRQFNAVLSSLFIFSINFSSVICVYSFSLIENIVFSIIVFCPPIKLHIDIIVVNY